MSKRQAYHHGNLRQQLIQTALELIAAEGAERVSLREIARRSGVSASAVYHHFADKQALLAAVATQGYLQLSAELGAALETAGPDPLQRHLTLGRAYLRFAQHHPATLRAMFSPEVSDCPTAELEQSANGAFSLLTANLAAGQAAGLFKAESPVLLGLAVWSQLHGLAVLLLDGHVQATLKAAAPELKPSPELIESLLQVYLGALRP